MAMAMAAAVVGKVKVEGAGTGMVAEDPAAADPEAKAGGWGAHPGREGGRAKEGPLPHNAVRTAARETRPMAAHGLRPAGSARAPAWVRRKVQSSRVQPSRVQPSRVQSSRVQSSRVQSSGVQSSRVNTVPSRPIQSRAVRSMREGVREGGDGGEGSGGGGGDGGGGGSGVGGGHGQGGGGGLAVGG